MPVKIQPCTADSAAQPRRSPGPRRIAGPRRSRRGFTLVEIVLVITIVTVLLVLLLPALGSARDVANAARCKGNERSLVQGWSAYTTDHNQYIIPGASRIANKASNICWYDNPDSASGNVVGAGFYHEGLLGQYVPAPSGKENSAYGCPGDSYYPSTLTHRITYNYSYEIQTGATAEPTYYANDKPYYVTGAGPYVGGSATVYDFNRLYLIRTQPSNVGILADGFYTNTSPGAAYRQGLGGGTYNQTNGITCDKASASDPTLVPIGNFADPLGSTSNSSGTTIYYSTFHTRKTTNIAFIDGHVEPMTWQDVLGRYPVKTAFDAFPFAINY